ncbi:MAG: hypothetical protein HXS54_00075 [Theionarchaea archaeon]|nr:hypothetical protein [Theionarchaea archaeon]
MKKILVLLLIVGLLVSACSIQVAAESTYGEDVSFLIEESSEYPFGNPVPCGGEGDGGGGTPG